MVQATFPTGHMWLLNKEALLFTFEDSVVRHRGQPFSREASWAMPTLVLFGSRVWGSPLVCSPSFLMETLAAAGSGVSRSLSTKLPGGQSGGQRAVADGRYDGIFSR